jgi:hypothetical protein
VPGELFSASGMYRNCLRLNCGNPHTPEIEDAVRRLGSIFAAVSSNWASIKLRYDCPFLAKPGILAFLNAFEGFSAHV